MLENQREYMVLVGERPWGHYVVLANEMDVKIKKVSILQGKRLSLQRHKLREEHWFIHSGNALISCDGKDTTMVAGDSIDIPRNTLHRMTNCGDDMLVFIEIQTGDYFGEDDIERVEDDYAR